MLKITLLKYFRILFILMVMISLSNAEKFTFKQLTDLASKDLGKNIYLDKDIEDYELEFNLVDYQEKGEIYELYKVVLFDNDLTLQHIPKADIYYVRAMEKDEFEPEAPKPIHEDLKVHYYTYKIRNITNDDIVKAMSIFPKVKYQYLAQSDMIAYSATRSEHEEIEDILYNADNNAKSKSIKITLFAINKKKFIDYGSSINSFQYNFDTTLDGLFQAFRSSKTSQFSLNDTVSIGFTLNALQGHNIADILQEPTLLLTNGVKSSVKSVVNVPYLKTTSLVDSTTNSVTQMYDYKDIGLQINVEPKIKGDWVYLNLNLISEELISLDDDKPITQKISYDNTVKVSKGKPILLTGIQKTSKQITKDGVPFLSDLVLIGHLFKKELIKDENQNINILIEVL